DGERGGRPAAEAEEADGTGPPTQGRQSSSLTGQKASAAVMPASGFASLSRATGSPGRTPASRLPSALATRAVLAAPGKPLSPSAAQPGAGRAAAARTARWRNSTAPAPLERLLVDRVIACWLQLHHVELLLAQQSGNLKMAQLEYHQRSRDRAHKRYLSS